LFSSIERIFKNVGFYLFVSLLMERKMRMSEKWILKYGLAAVLMAIIVIAVFLFANPPSSVTPNQSSVGTSFLVMLTDPPTVPAGTTMLNMTYTDVSLHVLFTNGTSVWLPVGGSGMVNLFSLVDMSQTIASTTIPNDSQVNMIQFNITDVKAEVNGTTYNVTALSNTLVVSVANSHVNESLSGVLVDFNPTLVQIQATDANGAIVYYYVLVPSATAVIISDLSREQVKVGTIVELGENNKAKLVHVVEEFTKNVTIVSASLSVKGNVTNLNVTVMNEGSLTFRIFGLTLHGEFNATRTWTGGMMDGMRIEKIHPDTIPFKVNDSSLIPLFGTGNERDEDFEDLKFYPLTLQPGQNVTLTFSGVIALQPEMMMEHPPIVVTPIVGEDYNIRLMGEGFETYSVPAKS
jgi:hypothetical protein